MTTAEWEPGEDWDAFEAIGRTLLAKLAGEAYNEDEALFATMVVSVVSLTQRGLSEEQAIRVVDSAMDHGDVCIALDADGTLDITIGEGIKAQ
jgi:hypothetical protein